MSLRIKREIQIKNAVAKIYRDTDWQEYRVKFWKDNEYLGEDADYHADDLDDCIGSANHILRHITN